MKSKYPHFFSAGPARDPIFIFNRDSEARADLRLQIEEMWVKFAPLCADGPKKFLAEVRNEFNVRAWELYLACSLIDHGIALRRAAPAGPDLCFEVPGSGNGWFEAILANPGDGPDNARLHWAQAGPNLKIAHPQAAHRVLRYANAIVTKHDKYWKDLRSGRVAEGEPFIIAISGASIESAEFQEEIPDFIKAALGIGEAAIVTAPESPEGARLVFPPRLSIPRKGRADVPTDLFYVDTFDPISGLLFSPWSLINLPPTPSDGMRFFHNPFASAPVPRHTFRFGIEYWVEDGLLKHQDWRVCSR